MVLWVRRNILKDILKIMIYPLMTLILNYNPPSSQYFLYWSYLIPFLTQGIISHVGSSDYLKGLTNLPKIQKKIIIRIITY